MTAFLTLVGLGLAVASSRAVSPAPPPPAAIPRSTTGPATAPGEESFSFRPAPRGSATVTDEAVVSALQRGADFLLSIEDNDNWENSTPARPGRGRGRPAGPGMVPWSRHGGKTALAVYALLHAGQSLQDDPIYGPKLQFRSKELSPAVAWLARLNTGATYVAALQANALALLPKKPDEKPGEGPQAALDRDYRYLVTAMGPSGGYTYSKPQFHGLLPGERSPTMGDLSNAQYGALGMWALEEAGLAAPPGYWQTTERFWRLMQRPSGSWPYAANVDETAERDSMGLAGIATLYITREFTQRTLRTNSREDPALETAMAWLNSRFSPNFGDLYSMYTIERIGLASGLRYFGEHDWYRELAANILAHQDPSGAWDSDSWPPEAKSFLGADAVTSTSFALVFLARGRNPVLFNKLQYEGNWNARPMDVAFLTRYLSKKLERPLNWQVVNLRPEAAEAGPPAATLSTPGAPETAPALTISGRDWLDAPILVITGSKDPEFTPADMARLREYVEGGGMIFSQSDEASAGFTDLMRKYAGQLVGGRYEMRRIPKDHPMFSSALNPALEGAPQLWGMSNGIREIWIHSPVDIAASWQLRRLASRVHFDIPMVLYFYQTSKTPLRGRLQTPDPAPLAQALPTRKATLARLLFSGNADPEPEAWPRLARLLRDQVSCGIDLQVKRILPMELDPAVYPLAHMTGTTKFPVRQEDCDALRKYIDAGGTLLVDSAGGSEAFTASIREMLQQVYPEVHLAPLPPDHPVYTGRFSQPGGNDLRRIEFRRYGEEQLHEKITDPAIEGLTVQGRLAVLFSKYDITSGLLGTQTWGIVGYAPASAQKLAENLVRFALDKR